MNKILADKYKINKTLDKRYPVLIVNLEENLNDIYSKVNQCEFKEYCLKSSFRNNNELNCVSIPYWHKNPKDFILALQSLNINTLQIGGINILSVIEIIRRNTNIKIIIVEELWINSETLLNKKEKVENNINLSNVPMEDLIVEIEKRKSATIKTAIENINNSIKELKKLNYKIYNDDDTNVFLKEIFIEDDIIYFGQDYAD